MNEMNRRLHKIYSALQIQREDILYAVKAAPEKFQLAPKPGKWSISQILTHIVTAEKLSLGYMKKKIQSVDQLNNSGISETLRLWLLIVSQRVPLKYKAPKVMIESTPDALSFDELVKEWDHVRNDLAAFLEGIEEKNVRKVIYKHPYAGRFDAHQALIFLHEHIIHHKPQIDRILNHPHP